MKAIFVFLFAVALCDLSVSVDRQREIADKINRLKTTWTAQAYERDLRPTLGAYLGHHILKKKEIQERNDLPESYDLRKAFPNCEAIQEVRDQSECGSCWAFGAAEVMSDRICIKSNGKLQTKVSTQYILSCCYTCG